MGRLPGAVLSVGTSSGHAYVEAFGYAQVFPEKRPMQTDTLFDIASLTKVTAALPAVMMLSEQGKIELDAPICRYLREFSGGSKSKITIRQLLIHTSGLPNSIKFYRYLTTREDAIKALYQAELTYPTGSQILYSDLGFMLLGLLVEHVSGEPLDAFATRHIFQPLGMSSACFNPAPALWHYTAATEFYRNMGGYQCGQVHDRNAKILGGVSGHAGLFATVDDLIRYAVLFLNNGSVGNVRLLLADTVQEMARNHTAGLNGSRGLGWVVYEPDDDSYASAFRSTGYGHTGFTGTSLYINPTLDLYVILLTNRVHYGRTDDIAYIRRQVHSMIASSLEG